MTKAEIEEQERLDELFRQPRYVREFYSHEAGLKRLVAYMDKNLLDASIAPDEKKVLYGAWRTRVAAYADNDTWRMKRADKQENGVFDRALVRMIEAANMAIIDDETSSDEAVMFNETAEWLTAKLGAELEPEEKSLFLELLN